MAILEELRLKDAELVSNPSTRLPVCVCVDASYSMQYNGRIQRINYGIRSFMQDIQNNIYAVDSVELCIISFGTEVKTVREFALTRDAKYEDIQADGRTPLGGAVMQALDKIQARQNIYESHGITTYKPWLILISDGASTDSFQEAARRTIQLQKNGSIKVLCIGIGDEANDLTNFKLDGEVLQLEALALTDFFSWLSKSMGKQSKQQPVADIEIPEQEELRKLGR